MPTKREQLREHQSRLFTDRVNELDTLTHFVTSSSEQSLVFVTGPSGIGKTTLLAEFERLCSTKLLVPVSYVHGSEISTVIDATRNIRDKFMCPEPKKFWVHFDKAVDDYLRIETKLKDNKAIPQGIFKILSKGIAFGSSIMPGVGPVVATIGNETIEQTLNLIHEMLTKTEADFYLHPEKHLTKALVHDLNAYAKEATLCLIFDAYETMSPLDEWLREDLFLELETYARVVFASQRQLSPMWDEWLSLGGKTLKLTVFSRRDAIDYLLKHQIPPHQVGGLVDFTGGLPLALAIAADSVKRLGIQISESSGESGSVIEQIVLQVMFGLPQEMRAILEACAVVRWFNEDILSALLERPITGDEFNHLIGLSFVRWFEQNLTLNKTLRDHIGRYLQQRSPRRFLALHEDMLHYYDALLPHLEGTLWQNAAREKLYHQFIVDQIKGIRLLSEMCASLLRVNQVDFAEALVQEAKLQLHNRTHPWVSYWHARVLQGHGKWDDATSVFIELLTENLSDFQLQAQVMESLAQIRHYQGKTEDAIQLYFGCLSLFRQLDDKMGIGRALIGLGETNRRRGQWAEAKQYLEEALLVFQDLRQNNEVGRASMQLGIISRLQGKFEIAKQYYLQSLKAFQESDSPYQVGVVLSHLGKNYRFQGNLVDAQQYCRQAYKVLSEIKANHRAAIALRDLADVQMEFGQLEEAQGSYLSALSVFESAQAQFDIAITYHGLMNLAYRKVDLIKADDYYKKARELRESINDQQGLGWMLVDRGSQLVDLKQWEEAHASYEEGRFIVSKFGNHYKDVEAQVGLQWIEDSTVQQSSLATLQALQGIAFAHKFYDLLARVLFLKGNQLMRESAFESAYEAYYQACLAAVQYNSYMLERMIGWIEQHFRFSSSTGEQSFLWATACDTISMLWRTSVSDGSTGEYLERRACSGISNYSYLTERLERLQVSLL